MVDNTDDFHPNFILRNAWLQTIIPNLFINSKIEYKRERIILNDGDFMDIDLNMANQTQSSLIILIHGFEGSSNSNYIKTTSNYFKKQNFDCISINLRGCSGTDNHKPYAYHSGKTDDIWEVYNKYSNGYKEIYIIGFSLGGNLSLRFGHDYPNLEKLKKIISISTPLDLESAAIKISSNKFLNHLFLKSLITKAISKAETYPEIFSKVKIKSIKSIIDFDEIFTSKLHGFESAIQYYSSVSSGKILNTLEYQTLIINSKDDPFLNNPNINITNSKVSILLTKFGGHVGYINNDLKLFYLSKIQEFIAT